MMTQILDSLPANYASGILCCYVNDTYKMILIRITNIANWYFERVAFPGEWLLFEALPEAELEVYTMNSFTVTLVESTTCDRLAVKNSQTGQACLARPEETFVDKPDKSLTSTETFISEESFSSHFIKES